MTKKAQEREASVSKWVGNINFSNSLAEDLRFSIHKCVCMKMRQSSLNFFWDVYIKLLFQYWRPSFLNLDLAKTLRNASSNLLVIIMMIFNFYVHSYILPEHMHTTAVACLSGLMKVKTCAIFCHHVLTHFP